MGLIEDAMNRRSAKVGQGIPSPKFVHALEQHRDVDPPTAVKIEPDDAHCLEYRLVCKDQNRAVIGAYKMLRTQVAHKLKANGWTSIGVTATKGGEGKTLTAINLALSLTNQPNQEVFLIDLDLHRHTVARYLGVENHGKLLDVLDGCPLNESLIQYGDQALYALLNDTKIDNSSEKLVGDEVSQLVQGIKRLGGIAIYDLPPLLATDDFLAFSGHVDCTLMVVAEGETIRSDLVRAKGLLGNTELLGVVLNKSREKTLSDAYYY